MSDVRLGVGVADLCPWCWQEYEKQRAKARPAHMQARGAAV
jgi:hypothetical protein